MNVIIAHDDIIIRKRVRQLIEGYGFDVLAEAENGLQAYNKYVEFKPKLIILNLNLPIYDGLSTMKRIKSYHSESICVMMGRHENNRELFEAIELGATHYIEVPIQEEEVHRVLKDVQYIISEME